eukprot:TRINITY_DN6428_c0_g1_i1.p1 TRINITY_DN6428_c0_g1~~TRINITY_DN6428_c0_g1_i1.p1  ORF type:complete len:124 (-),score=31.10 TRINITY_DN6428_c0_g1_i1:279-650(-)
MYPEEPEQSQPQRRPKVFRDEIEEKIQNDPELQSFIDVMRPRSTANTWGNDDSTLDRSRKNDKQINNKKQKAEIGNFRHFLEVQNLLRARMMRHIYNNPSIEGEVLDKQKRNKRNLDYDQQEE